MADCSAKEVDVTSVDRVDLSIEGLSISGTTITPTEVQEPHTLEHSSTNEASHLRPTVFVPPVDLSKPRDSVKALRELLNRTFRVTIKDG